VITIIAFLQFRGANLPAELSIGMKQCILGGIMLGSRQQLEQMNEAVERNDIHPVIDEKVFSLEKLITTR
jgi:hypothetical protein